MKYGLKMGVLLSICGLLGMAFFCLVRKSDPDKARAVEVAKKEAKVRGWTFPTVGNARFETNRWVVMVEDFPRRVGGHAVVVVGTNGDVIHYYPGK